MVNLNKYPNLVRVLKSLADEFQNVTEKREISELIIEKIQQMVKKTSKAVPSGSKIMEYNSDQDEENRITAVSMIEKANANPVNVVSDRQLRSSTRKLSTNAPIQSNYREKSVSLVKKRTSYDCHNTVSKKFKQKDASNESKNAKNEESYNVTTKEKMSQIVAGQESNDDRLSLFADEIITSLNSPEPVTDLDLPIALDEFEKADIVQATKDLQRAYSAMSSAAALTARSLMNFYNCYHKCCRDENGIANAQLRAATNKLLIENGMSEDKRGVDLARGSKVRKIFEASNSSYKIFLNGKTRWSALYKLNENELAKLLSYMGQRQPLQIKARPPLHKLKNFSADGLDVDVDDSIIEQLKSPNSWLGDFTVDGVLASLLPLDKITFIASQGFLGENDRVKIGKKNGPVGVLGRPLKDAPLILAPMHVFGNHWDALIIKGYDKTISDGISCEIHVFDSFFNGLIPKQKERIVNLLIMIAHHEQEEPLNLGPDHFQFIDDPCQRQTNQHDCGVHTIWTLLNFAQANTDQVQTWAGQVEIFNSTNYRLELIQHLAELMHQQDSTFQKTQWTQ